MYENLVAFLLGKKSELTNEEMKEFMELLCKAMDVTEEFQILEKQSIIENIIDSVDVKDKVERAVISDAIENILMFDDASSDSESQENLFEDKSENNEPLKARKVKRGRFNKSKESLLPENEQVKEISHTEAISVEQNKCDDVKSTTVVQESTSPNQIFQIDNTKIKSIQDTEKLPVFNFEIGELEENQFTGPSFEFDIDEN